MKSIRLFSLLLVVVLLVSSVIPAFAASGSYAFYGDTGTSYVVTKDDAPLRQSSSDSGKVLARLDLGQVLQVKRSFITIKGTRWMEVACFRDGTPITAYIYSGNIAALYYNRYTGTSGSIVTVCQKLGIDSSFSNRKLLAKANGITSYSGTAAQNTSLVKLAKAGKLIRIGVTKVIIDEAPSTVSYFPRYTGSSSSIVTALKAVGAQSSYAYRSQIAAANSISNYSGTAAQNLKMVDLLKQGRLIVPGSQSSNGSGQNTGSTGSTTAKPQTSGSKAVLLDANANLSVSNKARENGIRYISYAGQRSAEALNTVINQYDVANNARYRRTSTSTYCNIFAWDVMRAMGLEADFSHWLKDNKPATASTKGAHELNANATYNWINSYGSKYGWTKITAKQAQEYANAGYPVIAIWKNTSGGPGHIAVVRPEGNGYVYSTAKGPVIAQAGGSNFAYGNLSNGFGSAKMAKTQFWFHE